MKGIIYYTHGNIKPAILEGVQRQISLSGLPIVSCTLVPMQFGRNLVMDAPRGAGTMFRQILAALRASEPGQIFFCEHDVLYHPSHFTYDLPDTERFHYNTNVWKWDYYGTKCVTYDHIMSVSGITVDRDLAIDFYTKRIALIEERGWEALPTFGNPLWARKMGYEPGKQTKRKLEHAVAAEWQSDHPNIDIRHTRTMTPAKMKLADFVHKPTNWQETTIDRLSGWNQAWTLVQP